MYEMEQIDERVILVGIDTGNEDAANRSLDELSCNFRNWRKLQKRL